MDKIKDILQLVTDGLKQYALTAFACIIILAGAATVAYPQGAVTLVQIVLGGTPISGSNPLPVSGTFSASLAGFPTVQTTGTPIAVTSAGVSGNLPSGLVVVASNVGTTNVAYCKLGASATTSDQAIQPGSWFAFTVGANMQLTCITSTSTTTVNMVGGSGLPTGAGGGGSGGGGGGTVTQGPTGTNTAAWWVQIGDTANGPAAVAIAGADAVSNTQNGLAEYARNEVYNGTTWDRLRSGTATGSALVNNPTAANLNATVVGTGTFVTQSTVSQATASSLNATVVGTGTFATQLTGATNNINNIAGTISLPTGAATSANQATEITSLATIATNTGAPIPAGTNAIGSITNTSFGISGTLPAFAATPTFNIGTAPTIAVTGTFFQTTQPVSNAGTFAVQNTTATPAGTNAIGSVTQSAGPANVTATDCSGTVTTGGTAVNAFTAQTTLHGFTILNTNTSEVMWISFTTTAAASTAGSYPIPASTATTFAGGGSFTSPPGFGLNHALSVVAATSGHSFSCTWW
jgi:hypothetical protein